MSEPISVTCATCFQSFPWGSQHSCGSDPWGSILPPPGPTLNPTTQPIGCICPPGANLECQAPLCPRKGCGMATKEGERDGD